MQELSFKDILKALLPKMRLLVVIFLIGAFIGGAFGVFTKYDDHSYGTRIDFYVSPKPSEDSKKNDSQFGVYGAYGWHVMDNITKLLSSESFTEQLLLGDDKLPITSVIPERGTEEGDLLRKNMEAIREPLKDYERAQEAKEAALEEYEEKQEEYAKAVSIASKANSLYLSLINAQADQLTIEEALMEKDNAELQEESAKAALELAETKLENAKETAQEKLAVSEESFEEVYKVWRDTDIYKDTIKMIGKSIKFAFYSEKDLQVSTSTETLAKSFIYVTINVTESLDLANFVYDRVVEVLPRYVRENMAVPSGYIGTNCQRISRLDGVKEADIGAFALTAAAYALILGVLAAGAVACIIVISDRAGKWYQLNKSELSASSSKKTKKKARPIVEEFDDSIEE